MDVVRMALSGRLVGLEKMVGDSTVEQLLARGVFLNSEVDLNGALRFVPRLSIMRLRVFALHAAISAKPGILSQDDSNLLESMAVPALRTDPQYDSRDMEHFHAHWEVLVRLVGWTGKMSVHDFYHRSGKADIPRWTEGVTIDFCAKKDGIVSQSEEGSIVGGFFATPNCESVYVVRNSRNGFDMVLFERKVGGGHVAIFIDTKYSNPGAETHLDASEVGRKWELCRQWCQKSEAIETLRVTAEDCFLVVPSWRNACSGLRERISLERNGHILLLDRSDLTELYTPTLASRPHWIAGNELVRVERAGPNRT
jgi:hypothetical protein